jgi:hypothetical protein
MTAFWDIAPCILVGVDHSNEPKGASKRNEDALKAVPTGRNI